MQTIVTCLEHLEKPHRWSQRNQMDFNTKKCKIMRITRKQVSFTNSVHMNDTVLEEVKEFKDLGILTDCSLSWNSHTDVITTKANRMLGLIERTCKDLKDLNTAILKTLYCSLFRSNLECCSVVWSPFTKGNIGKLERIQRRATKLILKSNDQYDIRLRKLKLLTLEQRRFLFDVTSLFKAPNGYMDVDFSQFSDFYCQEDRYSFRHSENRSLKKRFARTNVIKNSFFHRIVDRWNILPFEIRSASNVCIFKSKVMKFLLKCK